MVINGAAKAEAVKRMYNGMVGCDCPDSFMQIHPDATIIMDAEAAALLK